MKEHYDFHSNVYTSVLQHHEWYNGEGYPLRRSGNDIPLYARILKLADGRKAIVMENYEDFILRPKIKVIPTGEIINLKEDAEARSITVVELLV